MKKRRKPTKEEILDFANSEIEYLSEKSKDWKRKYHAACLILGQIMVAEHLETSREELVELELETEEIEL